MSIILPEWTKYDNLYKALKKSCKNVRWKTSVTQFEINALSNVSKLLEELKTNNYQLKPYTEFDVYEPKRRHIKATRIRDRVVQRSFCDNYFYPLITQSFIYDNCACQIGKGPDFATKRLKQHYRKFYHKYRNNYGWVLKCDIHHFFESIDHNILKQLLIKKNMDDFSLNFIFQIIDSFGEVGLGLGSQVSQLLALFYLDELDHTIKEKFHIKAYIRYMDDFIIIHKDKEKLLEILNFLKEYLPSIGLELNNKTILQPISKKVSFIKWKFTLTDSGKVLMLVDSKEMTKKRRKVKAIINKYQTGQITKDQLDQSINGIMNHLSKGMTFKARKNLNNFIKQNLNDKGDI